MEKKEIKNLLKRREELIYMHEQFNDSCDESKPENINNIYLDGRKNASSLIYDIDLQLIKYIENDPVGYWLLHIKGMTVDIAAGLLVYFDIYAKDCAAQFIRFAGVDNKSKPHNKNAYDLIYRLTERFNKNSSSLYHKLEKDKYNELIETGDIEKDIAEVRARRFIMKVFVSHLFEEMYREAHNGELPARYEYEDSIIIEPEVPYTK
jgi:hypothetical protein